jgi:hypothetical protein
MADSVQLTDLDVIARYSIAVRSATADRDELLETLRADLAWLERGRTRTSTSSFLAQPDEAEDYDEEDAPVSRPVRATRSTSSRAPVKKTATKRVAPRRTAR